MLKVARHQPLQLVTGVGGEEEEDEEKEEEGKASGGASDTKSKVYCAVCSRIFRLRTPPCVYVYTYSAGRLKST